MANTRDVSGSPPLPSVSVLIPTLNSQRTLADCLRAIRSQDYPPDLVEIIIADGGSSDQTLQIAESFRATVVPNELVTGESGKAAALRHASGDLVALIDSDNILMSPNFFRAMVAPFEDKDVVGSEPVRFVATPGDTLVDRYCALAGVNDPLTLFIGNYDRFSFFTGRWTGMEFPQEHHAGYTVFPIAGRALPTIGANGTMYRREAILPHVDSYLMDIDIPYLLAAAHPSARFAKVDIGIRHLYCRDISAFRRKQTRRVRDYFDSERRHERIYPWASIGRLGIAKFVLSTLTVVPLLMQTARAWTATRDKAVFFHPVACAITLWVYGWNVLFARGLPMDRKGWQQ
ncbi:MAG: glycosyltransferase family 2 protein [Candidatus Baltobacteraceae bacterium]|jgi:glycosyltransferase involved in cell wall biosynthesis